MPKVKEKYLSCRVTREAYNEFMRICRDKDVRASALVCWLVERYIDEIQRGRY